ncbi:MAG: ferrous iron transport protein A [Bacteroidetes bacterium]|jgi:ferrous iron transport protein A|nr:ferrous iron transport protein A [Bacteroidota bacterium]
MKILSEQTETGVQRIKNVGGPEALRLLEMGLTPGSKVEVLRAAPTGFPIEVRVRGYNLSLRKSEAECIELE